MPPCGEFLKFICASGEQKPTAGQSRSLRTPRAHRLSLPGSVIRTVRLAAEIRAPSCSGPAATMKGGKAPIATQRTPRRYTRRARRCCSQTQVKLVAGLRQLTFECVRLPRHYRRRLAWFMASTRADRAAAVRRKGQRILEVAAAMFQGAYAIAPAAAAAVDEAYITAILGYVPSRYGGSVTVVRAADTARGVPRRTFGRVPGGGSPRSRSLREPGKARRGSAQPPVPPAVAVSRRRSRRACA
jgi:hypothetical protein